MTPIWGLRRGNIYDRKTTKLGVRRSYCAAGSIGGAGFNAAEDQLHKYISRRRGDNANELGDAPIGVPQRKSFASAIRFDAGQFERHRYHAACRSQWNGQV